jgi:hypothetical protein
MFIPLKEDRSDHLSIPVHNLPISTFTSTLRSINEESANLHPKLALIKRSINPKSKKSLNKKQKLTKLTPLNGDLESVTPESLKKQLKTLKKNRHFSDPNMIGFKITDPKYLTTLEKIGVSGEILSSDSIMEAGEKLEGSLSSLVVKRRTKLNMRDRKTVKIFKKTKVNYQSKTCSIAEFAI